MTVRQVLKKLRSENWEVVRTRGSHRVLRHAAKTGIVVVAGAPGKELAKGTLRSIAKQAGWESEE